MAKRGSILSLLGSGNADSTPVRSPSSKSSKERKESPDQKDVISRKSLETGGQASEKKVAGSSSAKIVTALPASIPLHSASMDVDNLTVSMENDKNNLTAKDPTVKEGEKDLKQIVIDQSKKIAEGVAARMKDNLPLLLEDGKKKRKRKTKPTAEDRVEHKLKEKHQENKKPLLPMAATSTRNRKVQEEGEVSDRSEKVNVRFGGTKTFAELEDFLCTDDDFLFAVNDNFLQELEEIVQGSKNPEGLADTSDVQILSDITKNPTVIATEGDEKRKLREKIESEKAAKITTDTNTLTADDPLTVQPNLSAEDFAANFQRAKDRLRTGKVRPLPKVIKIPPPYKSPPRLKKPVRIIVDTDELFLPRKLLKTKSALTGRADLCKLILLFEIKDFKSNRAVTSLQISLKTLLPLICLLLPDFKS